ncbi:MAG: glycogen/starch synthase [Fidelibacterota bacterium]
MSLKTYFLTSEIIPFAETTSLAHFSKFVPIRLQEHEHDIRLTAPKYGFISERKYILREVIRLRKIECQMRDEVLVASAKSAFIPQTRVQVYFMEHDRWFQPLNPLLYKSRNGRPLADNGDRFAFFSKTSLSMLTHLFWRPNVVICNNWQSAFVPILYTQLYAEQEFYQDIKTVQIIHSLDAYGQVSREIYDKLGVSLPEDTPENEVNVLAVASLFADLVIVVDDASGTLGKELSRDSHFQSIQDKVAGKQVSIVCEDTSQDNYNVVADEIHRILQHRFV